MLEIGLIVLAVYRYIRPVSIDPLKYVVLPFKLIWFVFVIYRFFSKSNDCRKTVKKLWYGHLLLLVESIVVLAAIALLLCFAGFLIYAVVSDRSKRISEGERNKKIANILKGAAQFKMDPNEAQYGEDCSICLGPFDKHHEVMKLPCKGHHCFHTE